MGIHTESTFSPNSYLFECSFILTGFLGGSGVRNLLANSGTPGDMGSIPRLGRSPGEGNGSPLQCSWWENSMDRGAWWATVHGVAKSQTWLKRLNMQAHICPHSWRHLLTAQCCIHRVGCWIDSECDPTSSRNTGQALQLFFHAIILGSLVPLIAIRLALAGLCTSARLYPELMLKSVQNSINKLPVTIILKKATYFWIVTCLSHVHQYGQHILSLIEVWESVLGQASVHALTLGKLDKLLNLSVRIFLFLLSWGQPEGVMRQWFWNAQCSVCLAACSLNIVYSTHHCHHLQNPDVFHMCFCSVQLSGVLNDAAPNIIKLQ